MATRSAQYYRDYREKNRDRINARRRELYHRRKSLRKGENVTELFPAAAEGLGSNKAAIQSKTINTAKGHHATRPRVAKGAIMDLDQIRQIVREIMGELVLFPVVQNKDVVRKAKPRKRLAVLCYSALIAIFICTNTYFLIGEQQNLYMSLGYSVAQSWFIALLMEATIVLLSATASFTHNIFWKALLYGCCALSCYVAVGVLESSSENRSHNKIAASAQSLQLQREIATLEAKERTALAIISNLDPKIYPTKITRLTQKLENNDMGGYSFQLRQARANLDELRSVSTSANEIFILSLQRKIALLCNIVLAGFLGYLWSARESLLDKLVARYKSYLNRPVDI